MFYFSSSATNKSSCFSFITNNGLPRRQDGPWAWLVLLCFFFGGLFGGGLAFGYGVILPSLMVSLNENRERTGTEMIPLMILTICHFFNRLPRACTFVIFCGRDLQLNVLFSFSALVGSLSMGLGLITSPIASKLSEKYTCRIAHGLGLIMIITGLTLSSLCRSVYPLYFTYSTMIGIGTALAYTSAYIAIRQYFNRRYSLAMGITSAGGGLGTLVVGPAMQALMDSFGWENTFRIIAGIFVLQFMFVIVVDPNVETESNNEARQKSMENPSKEVASVVTSSMTDNERIKNTIVLGFLDVSVWKFSEYMICVIAIFVSSFGQYTGLIHMVS